MMRFTKNLPSFGNLPPQSTFTLESEPKGAAYLLFVNQPLKPFKMKTKYALVLSGGGFKGAFQLGAMNYLS